MENIYAQFPQDLTREHFSDLVQSEHVRIERIISRGQSSPESGWYDQEDHEWVIVLEGSAGIRFEDGREIVLRKGDHVKIPAHVRHRVSHTDPDNITLWLAVFYR
ncbi:cupin domain-containing protein [Microbulbifer magnicolonia]|uniref:cupin domain-containing protein n=1 Tax=Microbulbifer magnicolonia TaxID=3109744 RepID=UPI002B414093|nr:cupin domain-containing protein [Microbulbifer sp. GG15]